MGLEGYSEEEEGRGSRMCMKSLHLSVICVVGLEAHKKLMFHSSEM